MREPQCVIPRCNVPGHFIKDCPTNGDPNYDLKRERPPTKSMLVATQDRSYGSSNGSTASLKANEAAAFVTELEGLPSMRFPVTRDLIPPELHCPLCKQLMKDAVFANKCCFKSFCYTCIRDHYVSSKFVCVCSARGVLADDLLPNITLRDTIARIMDSGSSSSSGNAVSSTYGAPDTLSVQSSRHNKGPAQPPVEQQEKKKRAASNGVLWDGLQLKKGRHEHNVAAGDQWPQPKKGPPKAPEEHQQGQQQRKERAASNGIPASNFWQKKARQDYSVAAGEQGMNMMHQVPFACNQHYWAGQPYGMVSGTAAAYDYQLY